MKTAILSIILCILYTSSIFAAEKFLTAGLNVSQFHDAVSKPLPGYSIGFGWEWKKGRSSALLFSPSFLYRGVKLEDKKIWNEPNKILIDDIWCKIGYLDLPFCYRIYFNNSSFYFSGGLSISLAVYDGSKSH